ncbi:MAG: transglycosylase domain-containing protein, partial [Rickettsiales bacterium]
TAKKHTTRSKTASASKRKRTTRRRKGPGLLRRYLTARNMSLLMATGFTFAIIGLLSLAYFMRDLPDISTLTEVKKTPSIMLESHDGQMIGSSGHIYGEYVRYNDIPRDLIKAVIATEDRSFFRHFGIDPFGLLRATVANIMAGHIVQGGSTITQQLAKNVFLTPERSLKRKVQELILAIGMEQRYSKQQIITVYLNRVYFGAGTYGIDAAARRYFGRPAKELLLPEAAMIAGLLKAPSRYAPTNNPDLAIGRATQVLINMEDAGLINKGQLEAAKTAYRQMDFAPQTTAGGRRYFTDWILEQIPDYVGTIEDDLIVTTTYDATLQGIAEKALSEAMDAETVEKYNAGQAALISMTPEGAVRAMIGGRDYGKSQYNRATQARRQPGSAFKLFVYLTALEQGWDPYDTVTDQPIEIDGWSPGNYNGSYDGDMRLREALGRSINTVAVQLSEMVGRENVINMAHRLGMKADMMPVPSLALGVTETSLLEITAAYAHLAADGRIVLPYGIETIRDTKGNLIYQRSKSSLGRVLDTQTVAKMNDLLMYTVESGTGRAAAIGRPAAGKTGTSQDFRDAWFIGYTPDLISGVWVGNDDASPTDHVTGGGLPARIWGKYMHAALAATPVASLPRTKRSWWGGNSRRVYEAGGGQMAPPPSASQDSSWDLGRAFWDKLFDESESSNDNAPESGDVPQYRAPPPVKR